MKYSFLSAIVVSSSVVALLIGRTFFGVDLDQTSLALFVLMMLPWFAFSIETLEAFGVKITFRKTEVQKEEKRKLKQR